MSTILSSSTPNVKEESVHTGPSTKEIAFTNVLSEILSKKFLNQETILTLAQTSPWIKTTLIASKRYNDWINSECSCSKCHHCARKFRLNTDGNYFDYAEQLFGTGLGIDVETSQHSHTLSSMPNGQLKMFVNIISGDVINCPQAQNLHLHVKYHRRYFLDPHGVIVNEVHRVGTLFWESDLMFDIESFINLTSLNLIQWGTDLCLSTLPPNLISMKLCGLNLKGQFSERSQLKHFDMIWHAIANLPEDNAFEVVLPHTLETFVTMDSNQYKFYLPSSLKCLATNVTAVGTYGSVYNYGITVDFGNSIGNKTLPNNLEIFLQFDEHVRFNKSFEINSIYHHNKNIFTVTTDGTYILGVDISAHTRKLKGFKQYDHQLVYTSLPSNLRILSLVHCPGFSQSLPKLETLYWSSQRSGADFTLLNLTMPNLKTINLFTNNFCELYRIIKSIDKKLSLQHLILQLDLDGNKINIVDCIPLAWSIKNISIILYGKFLENLTGNEKLEQKMEIREDVIFPPDSSGKERLMSQLVSKKVSDIVIDGIKNYWQEFSGSYIKHGQIIKISTSSSLDSIIIKTDDYLKLINEVDLRETFLDMD
jgi:hypothetical protein